MNERDSQSRRLEVKCWYTSKKDDKFITLALLPIRFPILKILGKNAMKAFGSYDPHTCIITIVRRTRIREIFLAGIHELIHWFIHCICGGWWVLELHNTFNKWDMKFRSATGWGWER